MSKPNAQAASTRSWLWLQGAVCGGLVMLAPGTALLLLTLFAVCLATFAFEQTPGRPITRSMMLMAAATVLRPLLHLWQRGGSIDAAIDVLADPLVPLWSWAASAASWLVGQLWEVAWVFIMQTASDRTSRRLKDEKASLIDEWKTLPQ